MSKAFVRETGDGQDEEDAPPGAASLPPGTPNYMTPTGHAKLKAELLDLLDTQRPEIVSLVSWAASNGDRSENGDYLYGKKRLREIDRRIRFLTKRLEQASVVDPKQQAQNDQVFFGAKVTYENDLGEQTTVHIVGVDEAQPLQGAISWISPVANALRKARVGDVVSVATPSGKRDLEILDIQY